MGGCDLVSPVGAHAAPGGELPPGLQRDAVFVNDGPRDGTARGLVRVASRIEARSDDAAEFNNGGDDGCCSQARLDAVVCVLQCGDDTRLSTVVILWERQPAFPHGVKGAALRAKFGNVWRERRVHSAQQQPHEGVAKVLSNFARLRPSHG
jgi:hypothetical protein